MKKILIAAMTLIVACSTAMAQSAKENNIDRKTAKSELKVKVDKNIRKEAKRLAKEDWQVKPGTLPLEKQLERAYLMQYEYDENNFPKYIMGEGSFIGENYDAAKTAATSLAITNLAGQIQTDVVALVENTVANKQLSADDAASITETVMASKNLISQSIGRTIPVIECFRITANRNTEVLVRIAYNSKMAKQAIRDELKKEESNLYKQLDKVLGL